MNDVLKVNLPSLRFSTVHLAFLYALTVGLTTVVRAQDGFCMINGTTTGGAGGPTVTVTNGSDFNTQINISGPRIIQVQGVLSIGRVKTRGDKTLIGLGTNATLLGNINVSDTGNVIIRNLRITSPANDGLTIWNAQHVWIDHCTIYDTGDGLCDMNRGSQYVTVSWCKFLYSPAQLEHRFTMIADGYDNNGTVTYGYYTLHHNWWSTNCDQRMPASSYGRIHMYNNYFTCAGNYYCSNARNDSQINSENNYYAGVNNPMTVSSGTTGLIRTSGNLYPGCTGTIHPGTDSVFTVPYAYTLDAAASVPSIVMAGAGAPGPDMIPIPPKIWDGGGTDNNLNTANNWLGNETPKVDDVLVFAGNLRRTPYNNLTANTEFYGLTFSNNAGAFTLGGNAINMGGPIIDDSPADQTINFDMDFGFGQFHYVTNREINVSSAGGSLVINGDMAGEENDYFDSYALTKSGDGLLVLNGINTFRASLYLDGGLVRFNTLNTAAAGSLGVGSSVTFNGGGLQWAPGNAADISARSVKINAGGATFDVGANSVTFAHAIGGNGSGSLTKQGTGSLTLNGNNYFSGDTIIQEGTLALGTAGALPNTTQIILSNGATLDVSGRTDGTLTLGSRKQLLGIGSVSGSVTAASGATISPGFSLGTLTVSSVLTFESGSTNVMELDSAAQTNDVITGMASVNYGGHLVLSNLNGTLAAGDTFILFSAASYSGGFSHIVWPSLDGSLVWTNKLAEDGTIVVVMPVDTTPTNLVYQVTNGTLTVSWPEDHISWRLEVQTNGLGTNWTSLGYETTNSAILPIDSASGSVFYRLAYP